jgi:hypothetical protein
MKEWRNNLVCVLAGVLAVLAGLWGVAGDYSRMLVLLGAVIILFLIKPTYSVNETAQRLWESLLYRLLGSGVLILLLLDFGFSAFGILQKKALWILLPCFAVAINNLPILSLIYGDAYLTQPGLI